MPGPQIAKQIDFSKGIFAGVARFEQPPGTVRSLSNYVYDRNGALQTTDGSLIISSFNGMGPVTQQPPIRFLVRYAQTGFTPRIYALSPTGQNVNVIDVSSSAYSSAAASLPSGYDLPNAVQAGDTLAVALGRGTTPGMLVGPTFPSVVPPWTNSWSAATNIPTWLPNVTVATGQPIQPNPANGHIYICLTINQGVAINQGVIDGITGATQPTFPTATAATVTDGTVVWQEAGLVAAPIPPGADFFFFHMGFLWAWGTNTVYSNNLDGPDSLRMSDLNNFYSWNPLNQTFLGKGDGTLPMGGAVMTLGETGITATDQIVLFKETSSYIVLGALGPNAQIRKVATGVGCVAPGSIAFIEELGVVRLSERGVTVFDGQNDSVEQWTAPIKPYLFGGSSDIMPVDWPNIRYAKACRVHNPPAYLLACPLAQMSGAKVFVGQVVVGAVPGGQIGGTFSLPPNLPAGASLYMTTSWDTSIWQTNTPNVAAVNWAVDTPSPDAGGMIYWMIAYAGTGGALTRLFVYHLILQAWAVVDLPFQISTLAYIPENPYPAYTLCGGSSDGTVRRLFSGDPDWDGVPINGYFTLPEIGNPATPSYIKQVALSGRAKFGIPCGFTSGSLSWMDRAGLIVRETLYVAPNQVPVYINIDKTFVSGSLRMNSTGPLILEGVEIAAQPKRYAPYSIDRDGGNMTINAPNGPPDSHGQTIPSATYAAGQSPVAADAPTLVINLPIAPLSLNYMVSITPSWNTTYWIISQTTINVTVGFGNPPEPAGVVAWNVIANTTNNPVAQVVVASGAPFTSVTFPQPVTTPYTPVINCNWNTKFWVISKSSTGMTIGFDTPPGPPGGIVYYTLGVTQ